MLTLCSTNVIVNISNEQRVTQMKNHIDINNKYIRSYKTEANLDAAIEKVGLANVVHENGGALRYMKVRNAEGRWTAIFLVSEYFRINKSGGYIGMASQFGFMSI